MPVKARHAEFRGKTITNVNGLLHRALREAVEDAIVEVNPRAANHVLAAGCILFRRQESGLRLFFKEQH
jgi:hypothetical protein